jgi:hypothetical protein
VAGLRLVFAGPDGDAWQALVVDESGRPRSLGIGDELAGTHVSQIRPGYVVLRPQGGKGELIKLVLGDAPAVRPGRRGQTR